MSTPSKKREKKKKLTFSLELDVGQAGESGPTKRGGDPCKLEHELGQRAGKAHLADDDGGAAQVVVAVDLAGPARTAGAKDRPGA